MRTVCDRCGSSAEGDGAITIRVLDGQLPSQLARVDLCPACARELGLWLRPVVPYADPPETEAEVLDDDQGDDDSAD
jgi:hypothetical protein